MQKVLGIDIGATKIEWALEDYLHTKKGNKIFLKKSITNKELLKIIKSIIAKNPNIKNISIAAAGLVNKNKILFMPNLKNIKNFSIKINSKNIKIENDLKAAAISQLYIHKQKNLNFKNFLVLGVGTGVGLGIVINKEVYRGKSNMAGEIGHCRWEKKEFEKLIAGFNIKKIFLKNSKKMLRFFSLGLVNLILLFDPDIIYICGSVGKAYLSKKSYKKFIYSQIEKYCFNKKPKIQRTFYPNPSLAGAILLYKK